MKDEMQHCEYGLISLMNTTPKPSFVSPNILHHDTTADEPNGIAIKQDACILDDVGIGANEPVALRRCQPNLLESAGILPRAESTNA